MTSIKNEYSEKIILEDADSIASEYLKYFKTMTNGNILITGGGGFLLSYFVDIVHILNSKHQLNISLFIYDLFKNGISKRLVNYKHNKKIKFIKKDVSKFFKIEDKFNLIIHGATIASPTFYKKFPIETLKVNTIGYYNILDQLISNKNLKNFIYMSSSEIYGDPEKNQIPTKESYNGNVSITGPRACYDESKRIGETISINYFKEHKIPIKIIRPFNVFGPGQNLKDGRFIPDIIGNIVNSSNLVLFSNGKPTRSFCYIADQIRGILEICEHGKYGESYNVGNDKEISMRDAAQKILNISNKKLKIIYKKNKQMNYNQDSPNRRCPDLSKINKLNDWKNLYSFEEGVKRTFKYYNIII